jgi:sialate O-acetylesterase
MSHLVVGSIFSDGCVIQRERPVALWGEAAPGARVSVEFAGQCLETTAFTGHWRVNLPPVPAGGPYRIRISSIAETIDIQNVLAGEVWLAGGQSNMEWPLKNTIGGRQTVEQATNDKIRLYNVLKVLYPGEAEEWPEKFPLAAAWRPANCENAGNFSAVGYYFALELHKILGVPIGIIDCTLGGSSASAWISRDRLASDSDLRSYLDEYDAALAGETLAEYVERNQQARRLAARLLPVLTRFDPEKEAPAFDYHRLPPRLLALVEALIRPGPRALFGSPAGLYENMFKTVVPYSVRGVIYYQGEADDYKARLYGKLLETLIANWRFDLEDLELPFLFVQLAAYGREGHPDGQTYALLREQQSKVAATVPHTGMAVALDTGSAVDIHPRRKQPIGHRLALLARALVYGEAIECSGPCYQSMRIEENRLVVSFRHAESGLTCSGDELLGFQICGENRKYYPALAVIRGGEVELTSAEVPWPAAASYGWANYMEVNLTNGDDLPALPFRTDRYL